MASVGGSIKEITIDGRPFPVAADADVALKIGGKKITVASNGDGSARYLGEVGPWSLSGIDISIDHDKADIQFLQDNADAMTAVSITIELIDGTVFQGKGIVADDHDFSTAKATTGLSLMGEGKLSAQ
jgi:hypothetical protein